MKKICCLLFLVSCIYSCKKSDAVLSNNVNTGSSGSTARFAVVGNTLYTVSLTDLNIFDLADKNNPTLAGTAHIGVTIETVFARDNSTLFVGSANGMYIYDISNRLLPNQLSFYQHFTSCDPVVADQNYAYLTLSSKADGRRCIRSVNQLQIIDVSNLSIRRL